MTIPVHQLKDYMSYAKTHKQKRAIFAMQAADGNIKRAAETMGVDLKGMYKLLSRIKDNAEVRGYAPGFDQDKPSPKAQFVKGVSTLYKDGEKALQWVKTDTNKQELYDQMVVAIDALREEIPRDPLLPMPDTAIDPAKSSNELVNQYTITDYHFGMLAWGEETGGDDWDLDIAEDLIVRWFEYAVGASPRAQSAILAQLGDLLHWDGFEALTPNSKNVLDADDRIQKVIRVTLRAIRRIIKIMLAKYETVHIIMADANHDPMSGAWLRETLAVFYENNPRVTVDNTAGTYYCYTVGQVMLCYHHGHKRNLKNIEQTFLGKFRKQYGKTEYAYGHLGHLHSDAVIETPTMKLEQHRTLAAPDAYASAGGWNSGRDAKVITYHKNFGEVSRMTISPRLVNSL